MNIKDLTTKDIEEMNYNQIIGIIKETNRPPGGKNTVFEIINRTKINEKSKVLEIGTSTGFTSMEISRFIRCSITAIDINEDSLAEAKSRADREGYDKINFIKADVNNLPFKNEEFDLIIVGNIFSLVLDKDRSFGECMRVCKRDGFVAATPMYYLEKPSKDIIQQVSKAIGVNIIPQYKKDWINSFTNSESELYWSKDFKFEYIEDEKIKNLTKEILSRSHLKNLTKETYERLSEIYKKFMYLFRDNLSKMGFTIILLAKKKIWEDQEIYTSRPIN